MARRVRVQLAVMVGRAVTRHLGGRGASVVAVAMPSEVRVDVAGMAAIARPAREAMAATEITVDRQLVAEAVMEVTVGRVVHPPSVVLAVTVALVETQRAEKGEMVGMAEQVDHRPSSFWALAVMVPTAAMQPRVQEVMADTEV